MTKDSETMTRVMDQCDPGTVHGLTGSSANSPLLMGFKAAPVAPLFIQGGDA